MPGSYQKPQSRQRRAAGGLRLRCHFPLDCLPADVAAAEAAGPADAVDRRIGALLRLRDRLAERADVEHAAAVGEDAVAVRAGACVENLDAFDLRGVVEAF